MRVSLARQEFTRTLPHTRGHRASRVAMMVQIELQQLQILRTDLPTQKEVRPQTTVDVFHPTAAAKRHRSQVQDRSL